MSTANPPGPSGGFLGLAPLAEFGRDHLGFVEKLAQTYGDIVYVPFGPFRVYLLNNPEYLRQVMVEDADKYQKWDRFKSTFAKFLGNGILISEGNFWKRQRKLSQPAFHARRVQAYAEIMVDRTRQICDSWQVGKDYEIFAEMMRLTMRTVSKTLFDAEISEEAVRISEATKILQEMVNIEFQAIIPLPDWIPTPRNIKERRATRDLHDAVKGFIDERRKTGEDKGDLLSMLLLAVDEDDGGQMTDQQALDEAITLFVAGHDTTASAATWTWYLLSQNPEVEAKLVEEIDRVLGGRLATAQDLPKLEYTEMVVKESMRLYPPVWMFFREPIEDVTLGGYTIPKGSIIEICPYVTHHDPRFFPEPDQFKPERFSDEAEISVPRYAYIPFGGGPRICIGQSFAVMHTQLILATIAQRRRLSLVPGQEIVSEPLVTQRPLNGLRMKVETR
jgi:cytochrome P450